MRIYNYWGKTGCGDGNQYHLLCWHSLDVAAVGYWMVKYNIYHIDSYLQKLGLRDTEQAAQFFSWLLCWHDIGKFSHSFQQLYSHIDFSAEHKPFRHYENISHSTLGYWLWNNYLNECL